MGESEILRVAREVGISAYKAGELRAGEQRDDSGGADSNMPRRAKYRVGERGNNVGVCRHRKGVL